MARWLWEPFQVAFMQRALLQIALLAVITGIVGTLVFLRRLAFAADAMTHTVFPGLAIAYAAGASLLLGALAAAALSAVLLTITTRVRRLDEDGALAVLVAAFFSVGVIVVSRTHSYAADLTILLFGRLLTVDAATIAQTAGLTLAVVVVVALTGKELVFRAFDPGGTDALGYRGWLLDLTLHGLVAIVVVAAARAVGTALVVALLLTPAATARLVTRRVVPMALAAMAIAAFAGWLGLVIAYDLSVHHGARLAAGATVTVVLTVVFLAVAAGTSVRTVRRRRQPTPAGVTR